MKSSSAKKLLGLIIVVLIAFLLVFVRTKRNTQPISLTPKANSVGSHAGDGLVRNPSKIHYSKHARCRMECRHIDETEVKEILANGQINFGKSELNNAKCRNRYAVEGRSKDAQDLRIIVAPCGDEETVVTVIDLGRDWSCDCEGGNNQNR